VLADAMAPTRAHVLLIDVFGYVALCLALLGLYGAIAYAAGARRRDLAIRAAVGARRRDLRLLMVRDEFQPIGIGLVAGLLAGTAAVPAVMRSVSTTVSADRWTAVYVLIAMLLVSTGASTAQVLDDAEAARDQAASTLERAKQVLARTEAEERSIALARHELTQLRERRELLLAELAELEVTRAKYDIYAPAVATVVQTQFIWPGELAQPGTSILAVLDPVDKYVRVYVPVEDSARLQVGQRVEIELDSEPGRRVPGEVSFVADQANFTPEKIETRKDRLGQVYRVKVRILKEPERFRPGTEGNVYPVDGTHG